jgi:hypothetical protein
MKDTTIADYIKSSKQKTLKITDYFYKGVLVDDTSRLYVLDDSILIPYDGELDTYRKSYTFTEEEYRKYKYNPWKVSYDVYGTTELWFLVLHANELYSAMEFDLETVSMYTTDVKKLLNEIVAIEDNSIRKNQAEVNKAMKGLPTKLNTI